MIGARQSNPKAQTLLGAMYATGHCVSRDLPTAYRWFAKALHGDPGNSRVQRDLEVLWKQMTPEETTAGDEESVARTSTTKDTNEAISDFPSWNCVLVVNRF